jgi:hypothetical protein
MYALVKIFVKADIKHSYIKCKILKKKKYLFAFLFQLRPHFCTTLYSLGKIVRRKMSVPAQKQKRCGGLSDTFSLEKPRIEIR